MDRLDKSKCATLKLLFNNEVDENEEHIFVDNVDSLSFEEVVQIALAKIGGKEEERLLLQYIDEDEELVTIKSTEELAIAFHSIRPAVAEGNEPPVLCVIVSFEDEGAKQEQQQQQQQQQQAHEEEGDEFEMILPSDCVDEVKPPQPELVEVQLVLPCSLQPTVQETVEVSAPVKEEEEAAAAVVSVTSGSASEEPSAAHQEVANQVIQEALPQEAAALYKTLETVIAEFEHANGDQLNSFNLRETFSQVLSDPSVVHELQEAIMTPMVRNLVVDVCVAERDGKDAWKAASAHMISLLRVVSAMLEKHPQLVALVPPVIATVMAFVKHQQELAGGVAQSSASAVSHDRSSSQVVHKHVQCNGCLEKSKGQVEYIRGARYKSAIVDDFDLCESCEATHKYRDSHGPFLKIYTPAQTPESILCVLRDDSRNRETGFAKFAEEELKGASSAENVFRSFEGETAEQFLEKIVSNHAADSQKVVAAATGQVTDSLVLGNGNVKAESNNLPAVCCAANHPLNRFLTPRAGYICDHCHRKFGIDIMHGCRICNFDLCEACFEQGLRGAAVNSTPARQQQPSPSIVRTPPMARPQAKFVADLSFPDGSVVTPGQSMVKKWRIRNHSPIAKWPIGCRVVNVGGEPFGAPTCGCPVPALDANEEAEISIPLIAPARSGRAIGYFRLITPDNIRFGHRLWLDVNVDGTLGERIAAAVVRPFRIIGEQIVSRVQEYEAGSVTSSSASIASDSASDLAQAASSETQSAASAVVEEESDPATKEWEEAMIRYSIEIDALNNMGFKDNFKNIEALKTNGGDIENTIAALLNGAE